MQRIKEVNYEELSCAEPEGVVRTFASLAYNRSQGIAMAENSNKEFVAFVVAEVEPQLARISSSAEFDNTHHEWVSRLQQKLHTHSGKLASYGQGQKSLNVWLKFYVDWASRPDMHVAQRLRPWLHCPLDSVVMGSLKERHPTEYKTRIVPHYRRLGTDYQLRHSLSPMDRGLYSAWQAWIKELCPNKPVLVDLLWAYER